MTTHTRKRVAAIYLRISYDKHSDEAGVARQLADARRLCQQEGFDVSDDMIFTDNDRTAKGTAVRPEFQRLMAMVERGLIDVIICYKPDRLSRNMTDTKRVMESGKRHKIIVMPTEGGKHDLANANGRLPFKFILDMAEWENEIKSERMKSKNEATRAAGWIAGGRRAFGYGKPTDPSDDRPMIIVEEEAEAIRWAYQAVLNGTSLIKIADHWNDLGLRTPQGTRGGRGSQTGTDGGEWRSPEVSRCLKKPLYAGRLVYVEKTPATETMPATRTVHDLGMGSWEAIIDERTFDSVMVIMGNPSRLSARGAKRLLTGVARCSVCDGVVNGSGSGMKGAAYGCATGKHFNRRSREIDALVVGAVIRRLALDDAPDLVKPDAGDPTADLYARKAELEQDLENQSELLSMNPRMKAAVHRTIAKINSELDEIDDAVARHTPTGSEMKSDLEALIKAKDHDKIEALWHGLSVDRQRRLISALLDVVIMPTGRGTRHFKEDTVSVTFKS